MALFHDDGCGCDDCQKRKRLALDRLAADPDLAEFYRRLKEKRKKASWRAKMGNNKTTDF
jgi:hypothetical protein